MKSDMYFTDFFHLMSLPCGTSVLGSTSFNETTHTNEPNQIRNITICKTKWKFGTRITLFVPATKSADASITSTANPSDFLAQTMQHKKTNAKIPNTIDPIRRYFWYDACSLATSALAPAD
jgi:hypothetical protein